MCVRERETGSVTGNGVAATPRGKRKRDLTELTSSVFPYFHRDLSHKTEGKEREKEEKREREKHKRRVRTCVRSKAGILP